MGSLQKDSRKHHITHLEPLDGSRRVSGGRAVEGGCGSLHHGGRVQRRTDLGWVCGVERWIMKTKYGYKDRYDVK